MTWFPGRNRPGGHSKTNVSAESRTQGPSWSMDMLEAAKLVTYPLLPHRHMGKVLHSSHHFHLPRALSQGSQPPPSILISTLQPVIIFKQSPEHGPILKTLKGFPSGSELSQSLLKTLRPCPLYHPQLHFPLVSSSYFATAI